MNGHLNGQLSQPDTLPLRSEDMELNDTDWLVPACAYGLSALICQQYSISPLISILVPQAPWLLSGNVKEK